MTAATTVFSALIVGGLKKKKIERKKEAVMKIGSRDRLFGASV